MSDRSDSILPHITFVASKDEISETPRGSALIIASLADKFGLTDIAKDLIGEKHHGLAIEHIIVIFLLYAAYGATSRHVCQWSQTESTAG